MAINNSETYNIDLGGDLDLNKNNSNIRQFEDFIENNGVVYDGSLHNLSYKKNLSNVIINNNDDRFYIENNTLYDSNNNKISSFDYEHFEIEDVKETSTLNTIDYYEDAEKKIILTDEYILVNDKSIYLDDTVNNIISTKITKNYIFILYKDAFGETYFYRYDIENDSSSNHKLNFDTYQNKIIYDEKYNAITLLELDYVKSLTFRFNELGNIEYLTFHLDPAINYLFKPEILLGDEKCASLKIFQNKPNTISKFETIFKIEKIENGEIYFNVDYDVSNKTLSGFFAEKDKINVYYNNGFFSHSSRLESNETSVKGISNKERISVGIKNTPNNKDKGETYFEGTMDESGLIKYNIKTYLQDRFSQYPALFKRNGQYAIQLKTVVPSQIIEFPRGWSGTERLSISPRTMISTPGAVMTSNAGKFTMRFAENDFKDTFYMNFSTLDGQSRQNREIRINGDLIGTFPAGQSTFQIQGELIKTSQQIAGEFNFTLENGPDVEFGVPDTEAFTPTGNSTYIKSTQYLINCKYIKLEFGDDFNVNLTQQLSLEIGGKKYLLDSNTVITVGDNSWALVDIFQDITFYQAFIIDAKTFDNFQLEKDYYTHEFHDKFYEYSRGTNITFYRENLTAGYYITTLPMAYPRNVMMTGNIALLAYTANKSISGNNIKHVSSTEVETTITIDNNIPLNVNSLTKSNILSYVSVGDGADINGNSVYGNTYKKGNFNLLYNNNALLGISYSKNNYLGTLITPWFSVDEDFEIKTYENILIYKDKNGVIKRIKIVDDGTLHYDYILDKYLIVNTTSYINCIDLSNISKHHYASDYNSRVRYSGLNSADDINIAINNTYLASGINVNYEITKGIPSMITNPTMIERVYGDTDKFIFSTCNTINELIDIYTSKDGATNPKYDCSLKIVNDLSYSKVSDIQLKNVLFPIETSGNIILSPCIVTKYSKNYFKNFVMLMEGSSYIGITQGVNNYLIYYLASEFDDLISVFNIQGIVYGVTKDKIYRLSIDNGILVDYDVVAKITGLNYIGSVISEAFFFSPVNNNIYSFTGDNNLKIKTSGSKIKNVYNSFYNTSTQDLYISTDIGLLVFSLINNYCVKKIADIDLTKDNIKEIYFPNDNKYIITFKSIQDGSIDISFNDEDIEFTKQPLILTTSFYGMVNNKKTRCSCWNITLKTDDVNKEGYIILKSETLTDKGIQTAENKIKINRKNWDKITQTYYLRYQPKYQTGVGNRLYIISDFPISALSVDVTNDSKQIAKYNK